MENNIIPRIITLSGDPGAGKSTLLKELKKLYEEKGFVVKPHLVSNAFRQIADERGISMAELTKQSLLRPEVDKIVDARIQKVSKEINTTSNPNTIHIFDSRMAWKFVDNSFSVYLQIPSQIGGERIFLDSSRNSADKYSCVEDAIKQSEKRKQLDIQKYQKLYGVDISNLNNYQLVIDTQNAKPEEVSKLISVCANLYRAGKFFPKMWQGNGTSVIPSKFNYSEKVTQGEELQR